ncbi:MAG: dihydropteroate synthase [bacterium]|nr:dihydropteroate synthase [bacterium]
MSDFIVKEVSNDIVDELERIGFDSSYKNVACNKYEYKNFKIFSLSLAQANILKQTALSFGADCAVHKDTVIGKVEKTDCIIGGSISQLKKIAEALKKQPFSLKKIADLILSKLDIKLESMNIKGHVFDYSRPYIVGILNLTANSFSDGGLYLDFEAAKNMFDKLVLDGADIIDIGAESTKPFAEEVDTDTQLKYLLPILEYIKTYNISVPISIDTRNAKVAKEVLKQGADIINDVSGLSFDSDMARVVADYGAKVIIQHTKGTPENMQVNPKYENLIDDVYKSLNDSIQFAQDKGVKFENIIADVGIGFGKKQEDNIQLIRRCNDFKTLGVPLMYGTSRKSFLNVKSNDNNLKDSLSLAVNSILANNGINFLRVHNVKLHRQMLLLKIFNH